MRKPSFSIFKNKDVPADQLRGNHVADQHLCFRYIDRTFTITLLDYFSNQKLQASSRLV